MPFTVITLTRIPPSLRGDLSKWMQEIAIGVFVGNFNVRVRERLWDRVKENIGDGQATLSYEKRNEIGYYFETFQAEREVIDSDGIPLVCIPNDVHLTAKVSQLNFSNARKFHQIRKHQKKSLSKKNGYIIIDIETTGLDEKTDKIFEMGAIKIEEEKKIEFHRLILVEQIPKFVKELTGIKQLEIERDGVTEKEALESFLEFVGDKTLVGYNLSFDRRFINHL